MHLGDSHFQPRVRHLKGRKIQPVFGTCQPPGGLEPFVKWRRGEWSQQAEDRQSWRPTPDLFERPPGHPGRVVVHAENEGCNRIEITLGEPLKHGRILSRFIEALIYVGKVD